MSSKNSAKRRNGKISTITTKTVIFNTAVSDDVYILTPEEERMIETVEAELDASLRIPHDIVMKETREWLSHPKRSK